jgi:hypothetical protein
MRAFIICNTESLSFEKVLFRYMTTSEYLRSKGIEPIIPVFEGKVLPLIDRLNLINQKCDTVFLLSDWITSKECMVEKCIADSLGKKILFDTGKCGHYEDGNIAVTAMTVAGAIEEVTGQPLREYEAGRKVREEFFYRMIFSHECNKRGLPPEIIMLFIKRRRTTIHYYLKKYESEKRYNPSFRAIVEMVDRKLQPEVINNNPTTEYAEALRE